VRRLLGDLAGALQSYQASVTIMGRAAKANPGNAGWQRDLSAMYNRVGDALKAQGRLGEALKSYQASLAIMDRLARIRPSA
jgi:tetratricopeptide (TPR) repeat protein